jgi:hypothetical protein
MLQFGIVVWACSLIGLSCEQTPNVSTIQTAYEREASSGSALHDTGLRVLEAKCHDYPGERAGNRFLCEVTFISTNDPTQRLFFDIVAVTRKSDHWELTSGLCKH